MNLEKSLDYFNPYKEINSEIHVVGVGAIGSTLIEQLVRLGVEKIHIWDFDTVEDKNLANQWFYGQTIGSLKEDAIHLQVNYINPKAEIISHGKWDKNILNGYVFLCVDSIELRREIIETNKFNNNIKGVFDFRMRNTDAQHYACGKGMAEMENILKTMQFSSEEAKDATPINACGGTLNVRHTVSCIVSFGVGNFIRLVKEQPIKKMILIDVEEASVISC